MVSLNGGPSTWRAHVDHTVGHARLNNRLLMYMAGVFRLFSLIRGWSDRRVAFCIFLALWLTYGFIGPGYKGVHNPNAVSRMP